MEFEKPEIGGHQRMLVSILGHFRSFFMLVIGSPLYQHFILVQNCHCMIASISKSCWCKQYKNPEKTMAGSYLCRREAWSQDGLLNQLHILMFPSLIQLTNRDHSQHLPPAAVMLAMNMTRSNTEAVCCIRGDASIFALPGNTFTGPPRLLLGQGM